MRNMPGGNDASVYSRIADATTTLIILMKRLQQELPHKPVHPPSVGGIPQGGHGPLASWNTRAALLFLEVHEGIRELEQNAKYMMSGRIRTRGGSDGNTSAALEGLPGLLSAAEHDVALMVARKLEAWAFRARLVLGEVEPFSRLPRLPGQGDPPCPWCQRQTLRYRPYSGIVKCVNPACQDSQGNQPQGTLDIGQYSGEPVLAWADGSTGVGVG
jgi:hypothetical protein